MIKVGNLEDLIDTKWIDDVVDIVLNNTGMLRPREGGKPEGDKGNREWQRAIDSGYSPEEIYFEMFDKNNLDYDIPTFHTCGRDRHWWITKMSPGQFMPMHVDPHTEYQANADRFWIPLQDWEPGHIFMYENIPVNDYKKADVFKYNNPQALHGAANIGLNTRIVLQVTLYEEDK